MGVQKAMPDERTLLYITLYMIINNSAQLRNTHCYEVYSTRVLLYYTASLHKLAAGRNLATMHSFKCIKQTNVWLHRF